eukprot:s2027_g2.t1
MCILAPCSLQESQQVHALPAQHVAANAEGDGSEAVKGKQWTIRDAMNFASGFSSKDAMMKHKPSEMDSDTWEEVCVVYDLCCQHGTQDTRLIQKHLVRHFEGGEETPDHDTSNMEKHGKVDECGEPTNSIEHVGEESQVPAPIQIDLVEDETTNHDGDQPKFSIPEIPGVPPSIVKEAIESLEQEDSQWDEAILYRRVGQCLAASNPPPPNDDNMQTLPWDMGVGDVVADTEMDDDSPPRPSEVPEKAGDPCAKNFKLPFKIVAVADSTLPQQEVDAACEMVEDVASMVAEAPPPVYTEQGQPRGRKPKKGSKLRKVKKHAKKSKSSKKVKNTKGKGKKSSVSSTVEVTEKSQDEKSPTVEGIDGQVEPPHVAPKTKKRVSKVKKTEKTVETGASAPAACPKPKASRRKRVSKAASAHPPAAPSPAADEVELVDLERPAADGLDSREAGPDEDEGEKPVRPDDAIDAPSHLTLNAIYSSAYRKAKAAKGTAEAARAVA